MDSECLCAIQVSFLITAHNGNVCDFPFLMKCIRMNNLLILVVFLKPVGAFDSLVLYRHQRLV